MERAFLGHSIRLKSKYFQLKGESETFVGRWRKQSNERAGREMEWRSAEVNEIRQSDPSGSSFTGLG